MSNDNKKISKFLSYILRHKPDAIGLELDGNGWARINELIEKSNQPLTTSIIQEIVRTNDKQRFIISDDGLRIRANQGHSVKVDIELSPLAPPKNLYHGTATRFLDAIMQQGLKPMSRNHVHLSADKNTAKSVGSRHGKVIVLTINTAQMQAEGHVFFLSKNKVWLTNTVPTKYIDVNENTGLDN